jgi:hypothetical protein
MNIEKYRKKLKSLYPHNLRRQAILINKPIYVPFYTEMTGPQWGFNRIPNLLRPETNKNLGSLDDNWI